jgi:hypothetical protein
MELFALAVWRGGIPAELVALRRVVCKLPRMAVRMNEGIGRSLLLDPRIRFD